MKSTIGIIGLWHLGCVLSASWYKLGHKVYGFDFDPGIVKKLNSGNPPIYEPELESTIIEGIKKKFLTFSTDINILAECDFVFLSYDTPVNDQDNSDTSILTQSILEVRSVLKNGCVVIISSQSPVGFCKKLRETLKKENMTFELAYSPENLRLGEAIKCYLNPGRVILGTADKKTELKCSNLFSEITDEIIKMNLESAEMVKHGINSFLATSIVFINNLADLCEVKNANIKDVVKGLKSDERIGEKAFLSPGIGFSGGTLGRDLKVLESINTITKKNADLFSIIHQLNTKRKNIIVSKVREILGTLNNKVIGVLGLTYKPGTSTLRRSLPLEIVNLFRSSNAVIKVFDPKADYSELSYEPNFVISKNIEEVAENGDILILLTEWEEFKNYDWSTVINMMNKKTFFDAKNVLDELKMKQFGFNYYSIGR